MNLVRLELSGFKSFAKKTAFDFSTSTVAIVGPNGSGKSNVAESIRFVLGEQSMKSMRGKRGEDLIWNGSNTQGRANRASVALTFNNTSRFLDIDFDEVVIERIVNRDGTNEYRLNGSVVRLKDILGLLASANIGQSGHHIISQGEADKILSASPRERREILEDALGLKVFQYKKDESVRKLNKTEENMRQVEALRREVQPHLRFLKRQVDKIQKAEDLRKEATSRFQEYFKNELAYIEHAKKELDTKKKELDSKLDAVRAKIKTTRDVLNSEAENADGKKIAALSEDIERVRAERIQASKESARLSGQIDALQVTLREAHVSGKALQSFVEKHEQELNQHIGSLESLVSYAKSLLRSLKDLLSQGGASANEIEKLNVEKQKALEEEKVAETREKALVAEIEALRKELDESRVQEREKERELFALTSEERELAHKEEVLAGDSTRLRMEEDEFKRESAEALALIGSGAVSYQKNGDAQVQRSEQEKEKRELQKIKIRLEEMGAGGSEEVLKEYEEASEREAFLERELDDLKESAASLKTLIDDLDTELRARFEEGIKAINDEFSRFFGLMFDGGGAKLTLVKEPVRRIRSLEDENDDGVPDEMEKTVDGIDIALSIPKKRIKSLVMLSGGERALTSIALIFAMSSVNPPPFLVLDETDAALDEANSRRYGDMVAALSEKSQLVLITHNRETMSRADILYGVTMGGDGVSKVLSVKLDEAVQVAK